MTCSQCGKEMEVLRKTKRYCSTRCRTIAMYLRSLPVSAMYQDAITLDEAVGILNWHYYNERDSMKEWSIMNTVNALMQKMNKPIQWDAGRGFYC